MINKISILRTVANNLKSHLCAEGKTKITKPGALIPGAIAAAGTVITLETKDNSANLIVQKDNAEIQNVKFNYNETHNGYELDSARSSYYYDDKNSKKILQNHYLIESENENIYEHSIDYTNAPMKKTTIKYIDKINSSIAQAAGYQSAKTDYDPQESHTYGKKSLQRDIPALLKLLDIIAPDSEFTLKMKDKLKKDNKTSLVAFEVNSTENKNGIIRGFMSTNGDSVSYHIDTDDMIIIGEQSSNKDLSIAYLKPEKTVPEQKEIKQEPKEEPNEEIKENTKEKRNKKTTKKVSQNKPTEKKADTKLSKKEIKEDGKQETTNNVSAKEQVIKTADDKPVHIYPKEHYINSIVEAATNKNLSTRKQVEVYTKTLALAYSDGYTKAELENILSADGLIEMSYYRKRTYVQMGISMAEDSDVKQLLVKTIDDKINELQKIKIDTDDEALRDCVQGMVKEISKIQDNTVKETLTDKALSVLNNSSSENYKSDLLLFIQETGKVNDNLKLHYEIYEEATNDIKVNTLKSQIEQMINNISDANHHEERGAFLTQLYITKDIDKLEQLQNEVQELLNEQHSPQKSTGTSTKVKPKKISIESLSGTNQKIVRKLLTCKSPTDISLAFNEIRNLLLDIGFTESNVRGTHYKFIPPIEIIFNGKKQTFLTVAYQKTKAPNPAQIDDLINVCKQYFGK